MRLSASATAILAGYLVSAYFRQALVAILTARLLSPSTPALD